MYNRINLANIFKYHPITLAEIFQYHPITLANMFQYVSTLRSMSKGRANYSMKLADYDFVPPNIELELKQGFSAAEEE